MTNFKNPKFLLIAILLFAAVARIIGIFYGYPLPVVADETPTILATLKMIGTHSLRANALGYYYLPVLSYIFLPVTAFFLVAGRLLGFFSGIADIKETVLMNLGFFLPFVRLITASFGVASVYLVYRISLKLFSNKTIGLLAAWFLAINFLHVVNSHLGNAWVPQTFFILLVFYWAINFLEKNKVGWKDSVSGGLAVGVAIGINFIGVLSYLWLLAVTFFRERSKKFINAFIKNKLFWLLNLTIILFFILISLINPSGFRNYFHRVTGGGSESTIGIEAILEGQGIGTYKPFTVNTYYISVFYLKTIAGQDPAIFLLAILGGIWIFKRNKKFFLLLIGWPLVYIILLSPLTRPYSRYVLPVIPLMAIAAAFAVNEIFERTKIGKNWKAVAILFISLFSILLAALFDLRMMKQDTRILVRNWIIKNVPSGAVIKNTDLGDVVSLVEDKKSIEVIKNKMPDLFSSKRKYLLSLPSEDYSVPNYFLISYPPMIESSPVPKYVVLANFDFNKLQEEKSADFLKKYSQIKVYYPTDAKISKKFPGPRELNIPYNEAVFNPLSLFKQYDFYGPYVEIYKLN